MYPACHSPKLGKFTSNCRGFYDGHSSNGILFVLEKPEMDRFGYGRKLCQERKPDDDYRRLGSGKCCGKLPAAGNVQGHI